MDNTGVFHNWNSGTSSNQSFSDPKHFSERISMPVFRKQDDSNQHLKHSREGRLSFEDKITDLEGEGAFINKHIGNVSRCKKTDIIKKHDEGKHRHCAIKCKINQNCAIRYNNNKGYRSAKSLNMFEKQSTKLHKRSFSVQEEPTHFDIKQSKNNMYNNTHLNAGNNYFGQSRDRHGCQFTGMSILRQHKLRHHPSKQQTHVYKFANESKKQKVIEPLVDHEKNSMEKSHVYGKKETNIDKKPKTRIKHASSDAVTLGNATCQTHQYLISHCLRKHYRLKHYIWTKSSVELLLLLRKKYTSLKVLFQKEPKLYLERFSIDNSQSMLTNTEACGTVKVEESLGSKPAIELELSKCEVKNENESSETSNILVDPRVISLSKTLQSGRNNEIGIQKVFKGHTSKQIMIKTRNKSIDCKKRRASHRLHMLHVKERLKEVNCKLIKQKQDGLIREKSLIVHSSMNKANIPQRIAHIKNSSHEKIDKTNINKTSSKNQLITVDTTEKAENLNMINDHVDDKMNDCILDDKMNLSFKDIENDIKSSFLSSDDDAMKFSSNNPTYGNKIPEESIELEGEESTNKDNYKMLDIEGNDTSDMLTNTTVSCNCTKSEAASGRESKSLEDLLFISTNKPNMSNSKGFMEKTNKDVLDGKYNGDMSTFKQDIAMVKSELKDIHKCKDQNEYIEIPCEKLQKYETNENLVLAKDDEYHLYKINELNDDRSLFAQSENVGEAEKMNNENLEIYCLADFHIIKNPLNFVNENVFPSKPQSNEILSDCHIDGNIEDDDDACHTVGYTEDDSCHIDGNIEDDTITTDKLKDETILVNFRCVEKQIYSTDNKILSKIEDTQCILEEEIKSSLNEPLDQVRDNTHVTEKRQLDTQMQTNEYVLVTKYDAKNATNESNEPNETIPVTKAKSIAAEDKDNNYKEDGENKCNVHLNIEHLDTVECDCDDRLDSTASKEPDLSTKVLTNSEKCDVKVSHKTHDDHSESSKLIKAPTSVVMQSSEERLMMDLPKHNWLFNKYHIQALTEKDKTDNENENRNSIKRKTKKESNYTDSAKSKIKKVGRKSVRKSTSKEEQLPTTKNNSDKDGVLKHCSPSKDVKDCAFIHQEFAPSLTEPENLLNHNCQSYSKITEEGNIENDASEKSYVLCPYQVMLGENNFSDKEFKSGTVILNPFDRHSNVTLNLKLSRKDSNYHKKKHISRDLEGCGTMKPNQHGKVSLSMEQSCVHNYGLENVPNHEKTRGHLSNNNAELIINENTITQKHLNKIIECTKSNGDFKVAVYREDEFNEEGKLEIDEAKFTEDKGYLKVGEHSITDIDDEKILEIDESDLLEKNHTEDSPEKSRTNDVEKSESCFLEENAAATNHQCSPIDLCTGKPEPGSFKRHPKPPVQLVHPQIKKLPVDTDHMTDGAERHNTNVQNITNISDADRNSSFVEVVNSGGTSSQNSENIYMSVERPLNVESTSVIQRDVLNTCNTSQLSLINNGLTTAQTTSTASLKTVGTLSVLYCNTGMIIPVQPFVQRVITDDGSPFVPANIVQLQGQPLTTLNKENHSTSVQSESLVNSLQIPVTLMQNQDHIAQLHTQPCLTSVQNNAHRYIVTASLQNLVVSSPSGITSKCLQQKDSHASVKQINGRTVGIRPPALILPKPQIITIQPQGPNQCFSLPLTCSTLPSTSSVTSTSQSVCITTQPVQSFYNQSNNVQSEITIKNTVTSSNICKSGNINSEVKQTGVLDEELKELENLEREIKMKEMEQEKMKKKRLELMEKMKKLELMEKLKQSKNITEIKDASLSVVEVVDNVVPKKTVDSFSRLHDESLQADREVRKQKMEILNIDSEHSSNLPKRTCKDVVLSLNSVDVENDNVFYCEEAVDLSSTSKANIVSTKKSVNKKIEHFSALLSYNTVEDDIFINADTGYICEEEIRGKSKDLDIESVSDDNSSAGVSCDKNKQEEYLDLSKKVTERKEHVMGDANKNIIENIVPEHKQSSDITVTQTFQQPDTDTYRLVCNDKSNTDIKININLKSSDHVYATLPPCDQIILKSERIPVLTSTSLTSAIAISSFVSSTTTSCISSHNAVALGVFQTLLVSESQEARRDQDCDRYDLNEVQSTQTNMKLGAIKPVVSVVGETKDILNMGSTVELKGGTSVCAKLLSGSVPDKLSEGKDISKLNNSTEIYKFLHAHDKPLIATITPPVSTNVFQLQKQRRIGYEEHDANVNQKLYKLQTEALSHVEQNLHPMLIYMQDSPANHRTVDKHMGNDIPDTAINVSSDAEVGNVLSCRMNIDSSMPAAKQHRVQERRVMKLNCAHYRSPPRKMSVTSNPPAAHKFFINAKAMLKKMNKTVCTVPAHIMQSCPYISHLQPIYQSPNEIIKPLSRPLQNMPPKPAHSNNAFRTAEHLIVQNKCSQKRKISGDIISTRGFHSHPNTPSSSGPTPAKRAFSSGQYDLPRNNEPAMMSLGNMQDEPYTSVQRPFIVPSPTYIHYKSVGPYNVTATSIHTPPSLLDKIPINGANPDNEVTEVIDLTDEGSSNTTNEQLGNKVLALQPRDQNENTVQHELSVALAKRYCLDLSNTETPEINNIDLNQHTPKDPQQKCTEMYFTAQSSKHKANYCSSQGAKSSYIVNEAQQRQRNFEMTHQARTMSSIPCRDQLSLPGNGMVENSNQKSLLKSMSPIQMQGFPQQSERQGNGVVNLSNWHRSREATSGECMPYHAAGSSLHLTNHKENLGHHALPSGSQQRNHQLQSIHSQAHAQAVLSHGAPPMPKLVQDQQRTLAHPRSMPHGLPSQRLIPHGSMPHGLPSQRLSPHGSMSQGLPNQNLSPHGSKSQGLPSQRLSPHGSIPHGLPSQRLSPRGSMSQGLPNQKLSPHGSIPQGFPNQRLSPHGSIPQRISAQRVSIPTTFPGNIMLQHRPIPSHPPPPYPMMAAIPFNDSQQPSQMQQLLTQSRTSTQQIMAGTVNSSFGASGSWSQSQDHISNNLELVVSRNNVSDNVVSGSTTAPLAIPGSVAQFQEQGPLRGTSGVLMTVSEYQLQKMQQIRAQYIRTQQVQARNQQLSAEQRTQISSGIPQQMTDYMQAETQNNVRVTNSLPQLAVAQQLNPQTTMVASKHQQAGVTGANMQGTAVTHHQRPVTNYLQGTAPVYQQELVIPSCNPGHQQRVILGEGQYTINTHNTNSDSPHQINSFDERQMVLSCSNDNPVLPFSQEKTHISHRPPFQSLKQARQSIQATHPIQITDVPTSFHQTHLHHFPENVGATTNVQLASHPIHVSSSITDHTITMPNYQLPITNHTVTMPNTLTTIYQKNQDLSQLHTNYCKLPKPVLTQTNTHSGLQGTKQDHGQVFMNYNQRQAVRNNQPVGNLVQQQSLPFPYHPSPMNIHPRSKTLHGQVSSVNDICFSNQKTYNQVLNTEQRYTLQTGGNIQSNQNTEQQYTLQGEGNTQSNQPQTLAHCKSHSQISAPGDVQIEKEHLHIQQVHGECVMCGEYSLYLCSNCKKIWYCSPECQLTHWQTHALECRGEGS